MMQFSWGGHHWIRSRRAEPEQGRSHFAPHSWQYHRPAAHQPIHNHKKTHQLHHTNWKNTRHRILMRTSTVNICQLCTQHITGQHSSYSDLGSLDLDTSADLTAPGWYHPAQSHTTKDMQTVCRISMGRETMVNTDSRLLLHNLHWCLGLRSEHVILPFQSFLYSTVPTVEYVYSSSLRNEGSNMPTCTEQVMFPVTDRPRSCVDRAKGARMNLKISV